MARRALRPRNRANGCVGIALAITGIAVVVIIVAAVAIGTVVWNRSVEASLQRPEVDDKTVFITAIAPLARESMEATGVPASVIMGQAILESGWGTSALSNWSGNYFGIKCGSTTSPRQNGCVSKETQEFYEPDKPTTEVAEFRSYATARDSFLDHGEFLRETPRYAGAFDHTDDPEEFITEVREAGYATDPKYSEMVISLMRDHDLFRYDKGAPNGTPVPERFAAAYRETGGLTGPLGAPLGAVQDGPVDQTAMIIFDRGVIIGSGKETYPLTGPLWERYRRDAEVRERLRAPIEVGTDGDEQFAEFEGGRLASVAGGEAEVSYR
ncbi:glucosaminidase domain-containing protein [Naumannella huperziae]